MSLTKPFRLFDLPLLPLEQVLLLTDPKALLLFALSSEKARELLRKFSWVKYFDIRVHDASVMFSICFKSREPLNWEFIMELPANASEKSRNLANIGYLDGKERKICVFKLDDMRMDLCEISDWIRCKLPKEHFIDYTQRIGYFLQSTFQCHRIRKLDAGKVGWEDEKVLFHMDRITSCEEFFFNMYDQDNFLEILEKTDVNWKISLKCNRRSDKELEWMKNEKIRNIPHLKLASVELPNSFSFLSQFLSLENEHLQLLCCKVNESALNEYLKKWMNGEFTKRRTLEVTNYQWHGLYDTALNGLTIEPVETWEKLGKPGFVRFSDELYLNPTPQTVPKKYQTVLLKNCHGQFATVVETWSTFYFTPWNHPLPPIDIPEGHELHQRSEWPVAPVVPRKV